MECSLFEQRSSQCCVPMDPLGLHDRHRRSWAPDALGVAWVVAVAFAVLAPALVHGASLGSFALINAVPYDQLSQYVPWTELAWTQVHHGLLPLWNPYSALGMPLAFNWQSATFSVPMLFAYLAPLGKAYSVEVMVTLVIAGTGTYLFCRVLRLGVIACVFAATVYELSGPFMAWLGWPQAGAFSWIGWLFAMTFIAVRGGKRVRNIALLAVVWSCAIYAGFPEGLVLLILALAAFLIVLLGLRAPRLGGSGPVLRPIIDVTVGTIAGAALGAPLALPSLQLSADSARAAPSALPGLHGALPLHDTLGVLFQGFWGLPTNSWFDSLFFFREYPEVTVYVGVIAVVMAITAIASRRRRPEVVALTVLVIATAALVYVPPVNSLMNAVPGVGGVLWTRARTPMVFAIAVLAGMGIDALIRERNLRAVRRWMGVGFASSAVLLLALWTFARGRLPPNEASVRSDSFIWPLIGTIVGLLVVGALAIVARASNAGMIAKGRPLHERSRWSAAVALLLCETVALFASGVFLWTAVPSSSTNVEVVGKGLYPKPAQMALKRAVGSELVGYKDPYLPPFSFNDILYGVQEFDVYDPMIPEALFRTWQTQTGETAGNPSSFQFLPSVQTATIGRRYGIRFVLVRTGVPGPQGAVFDTKIGADELYRIPGAALAILIPSGTSQRWPTLDAEGNPVPVTHPNPASWEMVTSSVKPAVLRLHLLDVPGWHATMDGRPLPLHQFSGVMLQARIPPGSHHIELRYFPNAFTAGVLLALCSAAGLVLALLGSKIRNRTPRIKVTKAI